MKLSEISPSIYHSLRLLMASTDKLEKQSDTKIPLIVSLTTIPSRVKTVCITIRSLLEQEAKPEKIILWLNDSFKNNLPKQLDKLQGEVFEIRYSPYTFSHRKLLHSLEQFSGKIIITCDDDMIYHRKWLKLLYQAHLKNPNAVIANQGREITYGDNGKPLPYLEWPFVKEKPNNKKLMMPVGAFGVLYPPQCFDKRVTDIDLILKLSPKSDDLWFKTMSLLNGTISMKSTEYVPDPIPIIGTQFISLKQINNGQDYKRVQWEQISAYFNFNFNFN